MAPPKKLGKYQIQSLIGKGSMGVVYKALDPTLDRAVAIKTLRTGLIDQDEKENTVLRFKAEARAYGRLLHQNIVTCFGCDDSNGLIYIVLEYVDGKSLKQLFDADEAFSLERSRNLMRQLLDALAYSHGRGVIHRDIKPANILVMAGDRVKVTDFGIARIDTSTLTQTGLVMGSPSYMAPEQFSGGRVDQRADIFAAAVIFYQMLTSRRPFGGSDLGEVLHNVLTVVPTLPSQINPAIPPALDEIVMKGLSKEPAARFQSAGEFESALMACSFVIKPNVLESSSTEDKGGATLVATCDDLSAQSGHPAELELIAHRPANENNKQPATSGEVEHALIDESALDAHSMKHDLANEPPISVEQQSTDTNMNANDEPLEAQDKLPEVIPRHRNGGESSSIKKWWLPASVAAIAAMFGVLAIVADQNAEPQATNGVAVPLAETDEVSSNSSESLNVADGAVPSQPVDGSFQLAAVEPSSATPPAAVEVGAASTSAPTDAAVPAFDLTPVNELTQAVPCGKVEARLTGNEVVLQGFIGNEDDRTGLAEAVNQVTGGRPVRSDISVLIWPYCELLPLISGLVRGQNIAENVAVRNHVSYREGDSLVLDLTTPDFASYIYVDYFLLDGSVVHLFPNSVERDNSVQPNQRLRIGDGPKSKRWEVSPPFGEEMITIIASARPLFKEPRAEMEKASDYLSALDASIREANEKELLANFTFVQTSAKQ